LALTFPEAWHEPSTAVRCSRGTGPLPPIQITIRTVRSKSPAVRPSVSVCLPARPSVRWSVCHSVRPSVCPFSRPSVPPVPSVGPSICPKRRAPRTSVLLPKGPSYMKCTSRVPGSTWPRTSACCTRRTDPPHGSCTTRTDPRACGHAPAPGRWLFDAWGQTDRLLGFLDGWRHRPRS
jgi:hypothetical protein